MAQAQEMGLSVYLQLNEGGSAVLSVLGTNIIASLAASAVILYVSVVLSNTHLPYVGQLRRRAFPPRGLGVGVQGVADVARRARGADEPRHLAVGGHLSAYSSPIRWATEKKGFPAARGTV